MFGTVVMELPHHSFEKIIEDAKKSSGVTDDASLSVKSLEDIIVAYKDVYRQHNKKMPIDPYQQLYMAVQAVFDSWSSPRAVKYREAESIIGLLGTAVNVQAMVFGNMGETSGTGVCFSRNPNNGDPQLYGEFLMNAQGEDGQFVFVLYYTR